MSPKFHDWFGAIGHAATLGMVLGHKAWRDAFFHGSLVGPVLLLAQEGVALVAHLCYGWLRYRGDIKPNARNPWKWLEYSVSATLGTIAALTLEGDTPEWYWITFLALTGAGQQFIGYQIDVEERDRDKIGGVIGISFILAVMLQIGEFIVVSAHNRPPSTVLVPYIVMWSLFGVHAGLRLLALMNPGKYVPWNNTGWVEAAYSCLSWMAKLFVFWTAFAVRYNHATNKKHVADNMVAGWSPAVALLLFVLYWNGKLRYQSRDNADAAIMMMLN